MDGYERAQDRAPDGQLADLEATNARVIRVLVIEDADSQRLLLLGQVRALGFEAYPARDGAEALAFLDEVRPHVIISDWFMPNMDGASLCRAVRTTQRGRLIYFVMLTAHGDDDRLVEAFDAGVDDFLTKPVNVRKLQARLRAGRRIVELQAELHRHAAELRGLNVELMRANERLYDAAHRDALTGLPNRRFMVERLQQAWAAYVRRRETFALILLDIDHFKHINDRYGHAVGDVVLAETAQALREEIRREDTVARFGGEEFLVLAPHGGLAAGLALAERMRGRIAAAPVRGDGHVVPVTASFGVVASDREESSWENLLRRADAALYRAKDGGRNCVRN